MTLKQHIGRALVTRFRVNRRALNLVRFEFNSALNSALAGIAPRYRRARAHLKDRRHLRVNIGSGGRGRAGWVNIDAIRTHRDQTFPWDVRRGLPFTNEQVAMIFAEHVLEHLDFREDVPRLLSDAYRVLEPGGRMRIVVPDGGRWLAAYVGGDPASWSGLGMDRLPADMPTPMAMINHVFHQDGEHLFAYDAETLAHVLKAAGFEHVEETAYGRSEESDLLLDQPHHAPYSLYMEARKLPNALDEFHRR